MWDTSECGVLSECGILVSVECLVSELIHKKAEHTKINHLYYGVHSYRYSDKIHTGYIYIYNTFIYIYNRRK